MNNAYIRAQQCKVKEAKFPFVKIGTQYWTKRNLDLSVTPQGNNIPEVQANGNVEKIANIADREFSSDTGFWTKSVGATISSGICNFNSVEINKGISKSFMVTSGRWIRVTITANITSGSVRVVLEGGGTGFGAQITQSGTYTIYLLPVNSGGIYIWGASTSNTLSIDNVSVQEVGWADSQNLYDYIYANTTGTVEQKTYAAVKAAAMWCNYANNIPIGLIYGKLYNWFAVKLFQMDIDYYNAANPTKKWANGFRMPTQVEVETLSAYLGGNAVSGGHLKETGLSHWSSPNTGADNSSGLTIIPSGMRSVDGSFIALATNFRAWTITETNSTNSKRILIDYDSPTFAFLDGDKRLGCSIRLIKA